MFKRLGYLFGVLAFAMAGAYLFVYLFRWEWNRALMAGLFFIAAEIALAAAAILERIKSVEKRISEIGRVEHAELLARLQENPVPPKEPFAWLTEGDNFNVFIPFLMGAGLIASGIAWVLERVARATAKPVLERGLAIKLAPLALPAGGFTGAPAAVDQSVHSRRTLHKQLAALALAILAGTIGLDVLGDATQTRPDVLVTGSESLVTMEVRTNGSIRGLEAARSVWGTCQGTVPNHLIHDAIHPKGSGRFALRLEPALGKNGERRLRGCLADATIDNIQTAVVSVRSSAGS